MTKRRLGRSELHISPFILGTNVFGHTVDEKTGFEILDAFREAGFETIDTANSYSMWAPGNKGGESESIIGKWMKDRGARKEMIIATKVGWEIPPDINGLSREQIMSEVEKSLRRLQTDYIDLYQSHRDDPDTPQEETLAAYDELIQQGKVRVIGASNYSAERLAEAVEISNQNNYPRYESLQPNYSLYVREDFEKETEKLCLDEEIGVITYFSLASGFLTGKYRSEDDLGKSVRGRSVRERYFNDRGWNILSALDSISSSNSATPAQVALAWLLHRPSVTAPISSATSVPQLKELLGSVEIKLSEEEIKLLDEASEWR